tara:strand:- start:160 stop:852 length:693 start_codon:yes stop_codon:yes gene_type:complete
MKLKWKIGIGVLVLFASLISVSSLFMLSMDQSQMPLPSIEPDPDPPPPPPNNVDNLLNEMEFAAIAFNAPTTINIDDSPQIQLILSLSETADMIKQSIIEEGERIGATIKVSNRMEARLSGYMFQISAITPETQAVSKSQSTEWKWEIYPKEEGQHRLHLTLTALLEIDGHSTPRAIRTFSKIIEVNVTATQKFGMFFKKNWQWLWAAILIPVAGWLWKRRKRQLTNTSS